MNKSDEIEFDDMKRLKSDLDEAMDLESIKVSEALIQSTLNLAKQQDINKDNQQTTEMFGKDKKTKRKRLRPYQYGMIAACVGVIAIAGIGIATGSIPIEELGSGIGSKKDCDKVAESTVVTDSVEESSDCEDAEASINTEESLMSDSGVSQDSSDSDTSVADENIDNSGFFTIKKGEEIYSIALEDIKCIEVYDSKDKVIHTINDTQKTTEIYECLEEIVGDNLLQNGEHKGQLTRHYVIIANDGLLWSKLDIKIPKMANHETTYQIERQLQTSEGDTIVDIITEVDPSIIESVDKLTEK